MNIEEKINKRIEKLEIQLNIYTEHFREESSISKLNALDKDISMLEFAIYQLKQLLN